MANAPATATYSNDPANVPLDRVRFEIGDTDCAKAYLTDAEIRMYLAEEPSVLRAASRAASAIAAKLARSVDFSHGPVRKSASQAFEHYNARARELSRRANLESVVPVATGVDVSEKEEANQDEGRVQPEFAKGMHDNPRSGATGAIDPTGSSQF